MDATKVLEELGFNFDDFTLHQRESMEDIVKEYDDGFEEQYDDAKDRVHNTCIDMQKYADGIPDEQEAIANTIYEFANDLEKIF